MADTDTDTDTDTASGAGPASPADLEPVGVVPRPTRLAYDYTPGAAASRFLKGIPSKHLRGQRCPRCTKVYIPPRGSCPTCGVPTDEEVELAHTGIVTTYCIVDIPFAGQAVECPYVCAYVLLDGADIAFQHLVYEVDAAEVRMGMRVEAVWDDDVRPTMESIRYFRPTGEPDADYETYKEHL